TPPSLPTSTTAPAPEGTARADHWPREKRPRATTTCRAGIEPPPPDGPSADERTYCRRQGSPALGLTRPAGVPDRTGQSVPGVSRTATPSRRAGFGVIRVIEDQ